jgi:hypothetical protein
MVPKFESTGKAWERFVDLFRMLPTLISFAFLLLIVYKIAPQQIGILVYTLCKLTAAGYVGYWLDRWTFPADRVEAPDEDNVADDPTVAQYRRTAIVCASLIASGLMS